MIVDTNNRYEALVTEFVVRPGVKSGKMFGMPCLKINGNVFATFNDGDMVFKLDTGARGRALALDGASLFDPMGGRPMKEWVHVPAAQVAAWPDLAEAAFEYVATLPPK